VFKTKKEKRRRVKKGHTVGRTGELINDELMNKLRKKLI